MFFLQSSSKEDSSKRSDNFWGRRWTLQHLFMSFSSWFAVAEVFDIANSKLWLFWNFRNLLILSCKGVWCSDSSEDLPSIMLSTVGITWVKLFSFTVVDGKTEVDFWGDRRSHIFSNIYKVVVKPRWMFSQFQANYFMFGQAFSNSEFLVTIFTVKILFIMFVFTNVNMLIKMILMVKSFAKGVFWLHFLWIDSHLSRSDLYLKDKLHDLHFSNGFFLLQIREWLSRVSFSVVW